MKKILLILTLLALTATRTTEAQELQDAPHVYKLAKDLDGDMVRDSVWFDKSKSVIVCRLSTRDFVPVESLPLEYVAENITSIAETQDGFCFSDDCMRAGYYYDFCYEQGSGKIRLVGMSEYAFGNAVNDGSGEGSLDLITGEYVGDRHYYDDSKDELIAIPTIETKMEFPSVYLEDFDEEWGFEMNSRSMALAEAIESKMRLERTVVALNDSISVRLRKTSREEYTVRKEAAAYLQPEPYEVITNKDQPGWLYEHPDEPFSTPFVEKSVSGDELQKMLGGRLKINEMPEKREYDGFEGEYPIVTYDITYDDGTKWHIDDAVFVAYFPRLETLLFNGNGGDYLYDLNYWSEDDGDYQRLNPLRCSVSPTGKWEIDGGSPDDIATESYKYYLARRENEKELYIGKLFADSKYWFDNHYMRNNCIEWTWVGDDIVLCRRIHNREEEFYEMTIIEKQHLQ